MNPLVSPAGPVGRAQAKSRHQHLPRHVRLGEETSARVTAETDPIQRCRPR
ncbi:hypothetical protein [Nonomuraea jabiensis]|uniref:hypothetical protein n=1 Tax=Nonomuraea jabiensis TaxID=882448 RepID=UPI0036886481